METISDLPEDSAINKESLNSIIEGLNSIKIQDFLNLEKITEYIFRVWAYDESDDKLFGYSDYKATKTWCDGSGQICSGFVDCNLCDGTRHM